MCYMYGLEIDTAILIMTFFASIFVIILYVICVAWWMTPSTTSFIVENSQSKIVSEYDQEIPQSQTADNPVAPRGRAAQPSQDTRKT